MSQAHLNSPVRQWALLCPWFATGDDKLSFPSRGSCDLVRRPMGYLERAKGFEPSTPTLARSCSTPELHPRPADPYHTGGGGLQALAPAAVASLGRAAARCAACPRRR